MGQSSDLGGGALVIRRSICHWDDAVGIPWNVGLTLSLIKIGDKADMVRQYNNDNHVLWWCGHYQSSFDGGPTAELLKKLADLVSQYT